MQPSIPAYLRRVVAGSTLALALAAAAPSHAALTIGTPDLEQEWGWKMQWSANAAPLFFSDLAGGPGISQFKLGDNTIRGCSVNGIFQAPCTAAPGTSSPFSLRVFGDGSMATGQGHFFLSTTGGLVTPSLLSEAQDVLKVSFAHDPGTPTHHVKLTWELHGNATVGAAPDSFQIQRTMTIGGTNPINVFTNDFFGSGVTGSDGLTVQYVDGAGNPVANGTSFLTTPGKIDSVRSAIVTFIGDQAVIPWGDKITVRGPKDGTLDFSHTLDFKVTADPGAIITSGSGVFLTQAVPEPTTFVMLATALITLAATVRRQRVRQQK